MKIDPLLEALKQQQALRIGESENTGNRDFERILQDEMGATDKADNVTPLPNLTELQFRIEQMDGNKMMVSAAENFLDLLDQYRQNLADTSVSLHELFPMIEQIGRERENLLPELETLTDPDLKDILEQALIFSTVELLKFERGDYIPAA